jgi:hypothetical protein
MKPIENINPDLFTLVAFVKALSNELYRKLFFHFLPSLKQVKQEDELDTINKIKEVAQKTQKAIYDLERTCSHPNQNSAEILAMMEHVFAGKSSADELEKLKARMKEYVAPPNPDAFNRYMKLAIPHQLHAFPPSA